ncbi:hypothetical protein SOV_06850 [Sporomusa ovata DSM 2662]|uniref:Uncharacterized protein n=1 Tax=Sporomusa ovata TaxID=2378 RepID=A0A0U1KX34_9FIRM|nr:hypothetical protein [Sporomusa ovata]EQB28343.1 hypothetical protein SOV_1c00230 [Sporomusa ovata DSM 2662]CQR71981.1 hypothetical protein SpAn4DRAFT_5222 [Sporomusa ovata]
MGQEVSARDSLRRKLQILEQIAVKNETLSRFVRDRKMTGLRRVLRERQALIDELAAVNAEWDNNPIWKHTPGLAHLLQEAAGKQQEVRERCRQVLQQAIAEKACIAAELKNNRVQQQIRSQYVTPWSVMLPGCRFNKKG